MVFDFQRTKLFQNNAPQKFNMDGENGHIKKESPFPRPISLGIHITGQITINPKPELRAPYFWPHFCGIPNRRWMVVIIFPFVIFFVFCIPNLCRLIWCCSDFFFPTSEIFFHLGDSDSRHGLSGETVNDSNVLQQTGPPNRIGSMGRTVYLPTNWCDISQVDRCS